jgi:Rap1a immunity proteins
MKMKIWLKLLPLVFLGSVSLPASALSGDQLLQHCTKTVESAEHNRCEGYIVGVVEGINTLTTSMKLLHPGGPEYPRLFCVAPSEPIKNLVDATTKYLSHNPGSGHYDAASEVLLALQAAFPCTGS